MISAEQIPDEVVEAAARSICETENGPCDCLPDECGCTYWRGHARAAITAALNEWPGVECRPTFGPSRIILPLPQEKSDE